MWTVKQISESDYGCEERMPGEPLLVSVTIECDDGRICRFDVSDEWLTMQELDEGDEWIDDPDAISEDEIRFSHQQEWIENYYDAISEMEEGQ